MNKEQHDARLQKKQEAVEIKKYKLQQRIFVMTSRFNTQTRAENERFREKHWKSGCLYCAPEEVSQQIPPLAKMVVLEMDNDQNQIFAIGLCANRAAVQKYTVYENHNYNRYNYIGKQRILRSEFNPTEEAVFKALDQITFFGPDHMKRGHGLKAFPTKLLVYCKSVLDIPTFLDNMFTQRIHDPKGV